MMQTYKVYFLILISTILFIILSSDCVQGRHIIGGDMYYTCNGNGNYTITMNVYRDCNSDGAPYDSPGFFAIYDAANNNVPFSELSANPTNITVIPPEDDPCSENTNPPCVQGATYTFTVNLPTIPSSYTVAYQRCCRNNTINNIVTPGDVGVTYTVEITPEAQQTCNNSPTFDNFPPIVICVGQSIDFDHGASDSEGDSLVYSFCSPLIGGGLDGSQGNPGVPSSPTGVQPNPPVGPPYNSVIFIAPTYTSTLPMGGDPVVSIDPETGFISGSPSTLGQFVVGVCVDEYRNGVLIGSIRRDFQFNVINCTPVVEADIVEDVTIGEKEFLINLCGDFSFDFINESISLTDTVAYLWSFDLGNDSIFTSTDENAFVTFPDLGSYVGTLVVNPDFICNDTAFIYVNVFPEVTSDFTFDYDTCAAAAVEFTDLSFGAGSVVEWEWNFGDGNTSNEQNPSHEYLVPGDFIVELTVRDTNECEATSTKEISYFPAPETLVINLDGFVGCAPETVLFDNLSFPIDSTYTINWDFGDSTTSSAISPIHIYEESGTYNVSLDVTSPIGCEVSVPFNATIEVRDAPIAGFSYTPETLNNFSPTATFTDESTDAIAWLWNFGNPDEASVLEQNPVYTFPSSGTYEVMQVVRHPSGCLDTATAIINVTDEITYFLPNAFTPNNDGINEEFKGVGFVEGMQNFSMTIWNRWGESIFETTDPDQGWDGRKNNQGDILQDGVYVVIVRYREPGGKDVEIKGFVTLVK